MGEGMILVYMMIKVVDVIFLRKIQRVRLKSCLLPRLLEVPHLLGGWIKMSLQKGIQE